MTESNLIPSMAIAFAVTTAFMVALRPIATSSGLVDRPGGRKFHHGDVPIIGGLAMLVGIYSGAIVVGSPDGLLPSVFMASLLLVAIGTLDDRYVIPATIRMVTQIAATLIMVYGAGLPLIEIGDPFGTGLISMGRFTLIFTMVVTLTIINAYNLIDGVDGLAGSLGLVALLAVAVAGGASEPSTALALIVSAAVVGFLLFNFPFAWNRQVRSFMGDAGSTLLGFTIVWVTLIISQGPERAISPVHCLWFASIPIYDSLTCFVRRALTGKSPLLPARDHFHHTLRRGSMGVRQVLGTLAGLQLSYAIIGLTAHYASVPDVTMFASWSVLGLTQWWVIRKISKTSRLMAWRRRRAHSA